MNAASPTNVLLVEDSPTDVLLAQEIVGGYPQLRLRHVERLQDAIRLMAETRIDVVLLDLGLPDSQGLDTLLNLLRERPDTPVVVMTARDDEDLALKAVHAGAQDYLVKSQVVNGILGRAIRYAIERRQAEMVRQERAAHASLSADIGVAFTKGGSLRELLQQCAESMVRNLGGVFARIWTLDDQSNVLDLQASAGLYTHIDGQHGRVPVGHLKIGLIAEKRKPHLTNDVLHDPRISDPEWARREGMVSFAGYPLLLEDRLVGVLAMFARKPLSQTTLQALLAVSNLIALGIERKRSDESLGQAQQRLQYVLASSPAILFTLAVEEHRILGLSWISDNLREVLGHGPEEATGADWWMANIHPEDCDRVVAEMQEQLFGQGRISHEYRFRHRDGTYRWTRGEIRMNYDSAGRPVEAVGSWADVSEQKQLEEQLRQAQKMEAIGSLAGGVAHDFNNLLTIINGYSEIIQTQLAADSPMRSLAREIGQAGERAASLTRQLLAFSRKQVLYPTVLILNSIVTDTAKMLNRLIGEDVDLDIALEPSLGQVKADAGQIEQVLINLAVNARDAMPRGGKLTIETANTVLDETYTQGYSGLRSGSYVMMAVTDTGTGMDEATKARIFEPFFTTKEPGKGTGLGLATVFGIVKQSGGHIAVYTELGRGTTFKVYLPRIEVMPGVGVDAPRQQMPAHGTETILLTEDEPGVRALARHVLQLHGYTVLEASQGDKALEIAEEYRGTIHLLVTDVVMPVMSGRQVAERLADIRPGTKILFLSGYTDDAVVRHGVLEAQVAFLQKPFTPGALAQKVREVLDT